MVDPIKFDRKPYKVQYTDQNGKIQTITRRPPPKLHDALPTDIVELTRKKNDDWDAGDDFEVKNINPRHPNTLQIVNGDGVSTFVSSYDMKLKRMVAPRDGVEALDVPERNRYLLWP